MMRRWALPVVVLGMCTAAPVGAQNPKLNLRVEQVTFAEALGALSKATGISLQVYQPRLPPNFPVRPTEARQMEKASFNWEGVTLAKALRDLAERYGVRPMRRYGAYEFYPGSVPKLPEKLTGLVEQDGLKLFARSVMIHQQNNRAVNFVGEDQNFGESDTMTLALGGVLAERDPATLAGVENVVAVDDLGNRLEWRRQGVYGSSSDFGTFPDEWSHNLYFRSPAPRAKKIVSLQGDLMGYRSVRPRKVEVPLPLPEKVVKREAGEATVIFSAYRELPPVDPEEDKPEVVGLPPNVNVRGRSPVQGPVVRMRIVTANAQPAVYSTREMPYVIGASGRQYRGTALGGGSTLGAGNVRVADSVYYFPDLEEPAVRIGWETVERGEVVKLSSFRMTDIPLPPPAGPARPAPGPPGGEVVQRRPQNPAADHPWAFPNGATLVGKVEILGKPATGGSLDLGMAKVAAGKPGALRWAEVPIDGQGSIRLINVQPGTYRVQLRYRGSAFGKARAGKWLGTTATVTLKAGQTATLPVLRGGGGPR